MKIAFLILNYMMYLDTIACVESIKRLEIDSSDLVEIIIVDNFSQNESRDVLLEKYCEDPQIKLIFNEKNLGFANGNNVGYRYCKQNKFDIIIQINNDTIIDDVFFTRKVKDILKREDFDVLGPDVLSLKDGYHQNPLPSFTLNRYNVCKKLLKNIIGLNLNRLGLIGFFKKDAKYFKRPWEEELDVTSVNNFTLQGACYIFSKNYIERMSGMFDGTFMFYEEHILKYYCQKNNLKMLYTPEIQILHKEGSTRDNVSRGNRDKLEFNYSESIKSLKNFIKAM